MWNELTSWLGQGQNAAAVQTACAVGTLLLTVVLAIITAWYVRLTHRLSALSKQQLVAQFTPRLVIELEATQADGLVRFVIRNEGDRAVRLFAINIVWPVPYQASREGRLGVMPDTQILKSTQHIVVSKRSR
jgi:hypothetical protein